MKVSEDANRPPTTGSLIRIQNHVFEAVAELGRGSYGVVWDAVDKSASCETSASIAIKWSSQTEVAKWEDGLFEAAVLKQLSNALSGKRDCVGRFPRYMAHTASRPRLSQLRPGERCGHARAGTVSIAMEKVAGKPLDKWLYGFDEQRLKTIRVAELFDVPHKDSQVASRNLDEAGKAAATLLSQMAPVFEALSSIAYHRDLSAHNLLVEAGSSQLDFAVIDFGLAVSSCRWGTQYKQRNLAGTPQYFPPATWMIFAYGHKYLEEHPDKGLLRQYLERLDHFSMGVVALELFFALWNGKDSESAAPPAEIVAARVSWREFWGMAISFYQEFNGRGVEG